MKRKLNAIIIHCAATPDGRPNTAFDIDSWHKARGFKRDSQAVRNFNPELKHIGYHFVIEVDGKIAPGRHLEEIGAHVQGSNAKSIGICMIGTSKYTAQQWESLRWLAMSLVSDISGRDFGGDQDKMLTWLKEAGITLKGHRDHSPDKNGNGIIERSEWLKDCPGFDVATWIKGGMKPLQEHLL
jgi:N-acetylmuramoyl-L-alanine amidase